MIPWREETRFLHAFGMLTLRQSFKNTGRNLPDWWGFAPCFNPPICTGLPVLCTRFTHGVSFWQKGAGGKFPAGGLRLIKRNRPEPQRCMGWFTGLPVLCTRFTHGVSFWQKGAGGKFPAGGLRLIKRNRPEPQRCMGWFFLSGGGMTFSVNVMPRRNMCG